MLSITKIISYYLPSMPMFVVYILQQTDYSPARFFNKLKGLPNLYSVKKRGQLQKTTKLKFLLILGYMVYASTMLVSVFLLFEQLYVAAVILFLLVPAICIGILLISVAVANQALIISRKKHTLRASQDLHSHHAQKIAVLGSFGKTTMKELLLHVLSEYFSVAATPGNQNIPISIAKWTSTHDKSEQLLIFEYGESKPGDIAELAKLTHPDFAVITGIAPNHLDMYKTLEVLADDLGSITKYVDTKNIFINKQALASLFAYVSKDIQIYDETTIGDWQISNQQITIHGISFDMQKEKQVLHITSRLIGRHNIGPLAAVATLALQLGMPIAKIQSAIASTAPFEHRMQPRQLHGAWIIDDTYNGNYEGLRAGLALLKELPAARKIYVTPGLVEQGSETERVHYEIGQAIAVAAPDMVVLMNNSVTNHILRGLHEQNFKGTIKIEQNPLAFYTHIDQFVAKGDIVLMQMIGLTAIVKNRSSY